MLWPCRGHGRTVITLDENRGGGGRGYALGFTEALACALRQQHYWTASAVVRSPKSKNDDGVSALFLRARHRAFRKKTPPLLNRFLVWALQITTAPKKWNGSWEVETRFFFMLEEVQAKVLCSVSPSTLKPLYFSFGQATPFPWSR